jgi:hypothetical protein
MILWEPDGRQVAEEVQARSANAHELARCCTPTYLEQQHVVENHAQHAPQQQRAQQQGGDRQPQHLVTPNDAREHCDWLAMAGWRPGERAARAEQHRPSSPALANSKNVASSNVKSRIAAINDKSCVHSKGVEDIKA